ncbi:Alpha/Beta hydrolase protein [Phialemonium atrogriseum]|uniref:Alpha/Beta hydrolase protein n=1 Tax=Phialemonium atrogriseum TaxID=1093897 RepID=A0AAJ0BVU0_9PEZI|nr:Alpha/Beta hydrolase protein [Phialemonium atrogriseum]KAK1765196.1 Alpha/Beta hydrolase protein [Phialemonium atrogriseum]
MEDTTKSLTLPDGRELVYDIYGAMASNTPTVFYFHGFPASHHEAALFSAPTARHGLRIIAPSRPGSSSSTFQPDRRFFDGPADVLALADHLGVSRFAVLGVSAGLCMPSRVVAVGIVAGIVPAALGTADMLLQSHILLWVAPWATSLVAWDMDWQFGEVAQDTGHPERLEQALEDMMRSRPGADRDAWESNRELRPAIVNSLREALRQGSYPAAWDARMLGSMWGFGLDELEIEPGQMVVWHGDQDVNVPLAMVKKGLALMPKAELRVVQGRVMAACVQINLTRSWPR